MIMIITINSVVALNNMSSALHLLIHFMPTTALHYQPHFTDEGSKAQQDYVPCQSDTATKGQS